MDQYYFDLNPENCENGIRFLPASAGKAGKQGTSELVGVGVTLLLLMHVKACKSIAKAYKSVIKAYESI